MDWIEANEPDIVMMAGAGRKYNIIDERGEYFLGDARTDEWLRGLGFTIEGLPDGTHPMVIADTPFMKRINPVNCVRDNQRDLSQCSTIRAKAIDRKFDQAEREFTESMGGTYADLNDKICPYSPCPAVIGDTLLYRNADHITATYAEQIAPSMGAVLSDVLGVLAQGEGADVVASGESAETSVELDEGAESAEPPVSNETAEADGA